MRTRSRPTRVFARMGFGFNMSLFAVHAAALVPIDVFDTVDFWRFITDVSLTLFIFNIR